MFFMVLLISTFVSFSCSDKDDLVGQVDSTKSTISVEGVKIAYINGEGEVKMTYSDEKVIDYFNKENPGYTLEGTELYDFDLNSIDSDVTLAFYTHSAENNQDLTFGVFSILKVEEEGGQIAYYLYSNDDSKAVGPKLTLNIACVRTDGCQTCNAPVLDKNTGKYYCNNDRCIEGSCKIKAWITRGLSLDMGAFVL